MKRRMIATDIVSEGRFLRMSLTAQGLYLHLVANADDDGCVDAFTVLRMVGAKEDDLILLKEREYVTILDEREYILWITRWQDFNWIDPRIKEDSKYLPLLRARVEGLEIIESTKKEANKRRYEKLKIERQLKKENDPQEDHMMISVVSTHDLPRRIGKDRVGEDRKEGVSNDTPKAAPEARLGRDKFLETMKPDTRELWDHWERHHDTIHSNLEDNRSALNKLMEADGPEKTMKLIELAARAWSEPYTPKEAKASSPSQLWIKRSSLLSWGRGKFQQSVIPGS